MVFSARAPVHVTSRWVLQTLLHLESLAHVWLSQSRSLERALRLPLVAPYPCPQPPPGSRLGFKAPQTPYSLRSLSGLPRTFGAFGTVHVLSWFSRLASHLSPEVCNRSQVLL